MGLFTKTVQYLKDHLGKTRDKITSSLSAVLTLGRSIDEKLLDELEETLISDDIGVETTDKLVSDLRQAYRSKKIAKTDEIIPFLKDRMKDYWPEQDRQLKTADSGPTVILVAGINGSGKTTSIAKLAYILNKNGKEVIVAACDTFRAAAVEQLSIWAERIGVQIVKHKMGADPAAVAYDACEAAVAAMRRLPNVILPFPGGVVRSGSKVRSKYKALMASTNQAFCPTLRGLTASNLSSEVRSATIEFSRRRSASSGASPGSPARTDQLSACR